METLQEVLESESNTQIHKYFNMNLFKDIIAGNHLKTKRSSDSDLHGPTKKKICNNFTIEDIIPNESSFSELT